MARIGGIEDVVMKSLQLLNAMEINEIVGAMCEIAYDVVFEEVATTVASQVKSENTDTTRDRYMELMDAGLPQPIRSQVAKVFPTHFAEV